MRVRREILVFLKVLRVAISSPVNLITGAIVAEIFVMIATAPMPSMVYIGDKPREALVVATVLFMSLFGLYLLIRMAVAIFGNGVRRYFLPAHFGLCSCRSLLVLPPTTVTVIGTKRRSTRLRLSYTIWKRNAYLAPASIYLN